MHVQSRYLVTYFTPPCEEVKIADVFLSYLWVRQGDMLTVETRAEISLLANERMKGVMLKSYPT